MLIFSSTSSAKQFFQQKDFSLKKKTPALRVFGASLLLRLTIEKRKRREKNDECSKNNFFNLFYLHVAPRPLLHDDDAVGET